LVLRGSALPEPNCSLKKKLHPTVLHYVYHYMIGFTSAACSGLPWLHSNLLELLAQTESMQKAGIRSLLLAALSLNKRYKLTLNEECLCT